MSETSNLGQPGQVTCICVDAAHGPDDAWHDQVLQRIRVAIQAGVPVVYVDSGGYDLNTDIVRSEIGPTNLLLTVKDEDDVLVVPTLDSPETVSAISYGLPTLAVARDAADAHERRHGPAMLVIDEIDFARPFAGLDDDTAIDDPINNLAHTAIQLSPTQVQRWRNDELLHLAKARPNRPTIVVARSCRVGNTLTAVPAPAL